MILAAGFFSPVTVGTETINVDGAEPKLHWRDADITTRDAMMKSLSIDQSVTFTAYQKIENRTIKVII